MADPLSVAGLASAILSLGIQVSGGITTYIDVLDCRDEDISSLRQRADTLQKTPRLVQTSLLQFQGDHQDATEAVHEYLDSCNKELKSLESLLVKLTAYDQPTTDRARRIKNKGKRLPFPFSRGKLDQLETKLRDSNAGL